MHRAPHEKYPNPCPLRLTELPVGDSLKSFSVRNEIDVQVFTCKIATSKLCGLGMSSSSEQELVGFQDLSEIHIARIYLELQVTQTERDQLPQLTEFSALFPRPQPSQRRSLVHSLLSHAV
jgi:hypothetical protein